MIRRIIGICRLFIALNRLATAEEKLNKNNISAALKILDRIKEERFKINASLMKADALLALRNNKEALKVLQYSNDLISTLADRGQKKKY